MGRAMPCAAQHWFRGGGGEGRRHAPEGHVEEGGTVLLTSAVAVGGLGSAAHGNLADRLAAEALVVHHALVAVVREVVDQQARR